MAVGTHKGYVQIWDAGAGKKLFALEGHTARVGENICFVTAKVSITANELKA